MTEVKELFADFSGEDETEELGEFGDMVNELLEAKLGEAGWFGEAGEEIWVCLLEALPMISAAVMEMI